MAETLHKPSEPQASERRRAARHKSFLRGQIRWAGGIGLDCLVRDISQDGARLIMSEAVVTPDLVELHIPQKEQTLRVRVMWRFGREFGVSFVQPVHVGAPGEPAELADRVARLEAEVAALKRLLKRARSDGALEFETP